MSVHEGAARSEERGRRGDQQRRLRCELDADRSLAGLAVDPLKVHDADRLVSGLLEERQAGPKLQVENGLRALELGERRRLHFDRSLTEDFFREAYVLAERALGAQLVLESFDLLSGWCDQDFEIEDALNEGFDGVDLRCHSELALSG